MTGKDENQDEDEELKELAQSVADSLFLHGCAVLRRLLPASVVESARQRVISDLESTGHSDSSGRILGREGTEPSLLSRQDLA